MKARKLPKLVRYKQEPGECSVAACASVANYYNPDINYEIARTLAKCRGDGMYTPQIGKLLNELGFTNVSIISADLHTLDFKWKDLDQDDLVKELKKVTKKHKDRTVRDIAQHYVDFINNPDCCNELIIDRHFGRYIRKYVGQEGKPILASYNWNLFFEFPKWNTENRVDPVKGETEEHEIVIYGCDDNGVDILDSHYEMYEGRLQKYQNGRYRMDWETLMTVMGFGDIIIPGGYECPTHELV